MYSQINLKIIAGMTPTAAKLYGYAVSRPLPATISFEDFRRLCGLDETGPGWKEELERVCRELVSANVVKNAYAVDDVIHLN